MSSIWLVEVDEEGRDDDEEDVGEGVDKLCNVGGEGVVVLAPVHGAGAPGGMLPVEERHRKHQGKIIFCLKNLL